MSTTETKPPSRSPPPRDGVMTRLVKTLFLRTAEVAAIDALSANFLVIHLEGPSLKGVAWTPGDKVQVGMGAGFATRTYTPLSWDASSGRTQLLIYLHADTPGCRWARDAAIGDPVEFMGPRRSLDLPSITGPTTLFGDETCFGLARALRSVPAGRTSSCVFEVADAAEAETVLAATGVSDAKLFERTAEGGHLHAAHDALLDEANDERRFVLAGKGQSIQSTKRALEGAGIGNARLSTKAYWAPGKIGLD